MSRALAFLFAGILFGVGLVVSGMTDPGKVTGFLDVSGAWDPSLGLVMVAAMLVYGIGSPLVLRRRQPVLGGSFPSGRDSKLDRRLFWGSATFGVGWGIVGLCPGPAVTNLGALRVQAVVFVATVVVGMLVAQRLLGADR